MSATSHPYGLQQVYPLVDSEVLTMIDIIAIHGLDTSAPQTWEYRYDRSDGGGVVNWLSDITMLPAAVPNARIFTYNWHAEFYQDALDLTLRNHAEGLLLDIRAMREEKGVPASRPVLFIASCFGGIVIVKALNSAAVEGSPYSSIRRITAGIVFLGTPFKGTAAYTKAQWLITYSSFTGAKTSLALIKDLDKSTGVLDELVNEFALNSKTKDYFLPMYCFFETVETNLSKKVLSEPLANLLGRHEFLVDRSSACLLGTECFSLDCRHVMMNKFAPNTQNFRRVKSAIFNLVKGAEAIIIRRDRNWSTFTDDLRSSAENMHRSALLCDLPISGQQFFGRVLDLDRIRSVLNPEKSGRKAVVLWGLSGSGKTRLALRYNELYGQDYSAVLWIDATSFQYDSQPGIEKSGYERAVECFSQAAAEIALNYPSSALRSPTNSSKDMDFVKKWLEISSNDSWLMIIDSVDELDRFDCRRLIPICNHGTVIVTSTLSRTASALGIPGIEIAGLDEHAGSGLLLSKSDTLHRSTEVLEEAKKIVQTLDGFPLAIEQAGALLQNGISIHEFLRFYETQYKDLMEQKPERSSWFYDKNRSILSTFNTLNDFLAAEEPEAAKLLSFSSLFAPREVPVSFLTQFMFLENSIRGGNDTIPSQLREAERMSKIASWLVHLRNNEVAFQRAVTRLESLCLFKLRKGINGAVTHFSLHNSIRKWRVEMLSEDEREEGIIISAYTISKVLCDAMGKIEPNALKYIPFVLHCSRMIQKYANLENIAAPAGRFCHIYGFISAQFAKLYLEFGYTTDALEMFSATVEYEAILQRKSWPADRRSLNLIEGLSMAFWKLGNLEKAEESFEFLYESCLKILDYADDTTMLAATRLREVRHRRNQYAQDEQRAYLASAGAKAGLNSNPEQNANEISPLPDYFSLDMTDEEYRLVQILEQSRTEFGENDDDTVRALQDLAKFYMDAGEFSKSAPLFQQLIKMYDSRGRKREQPRLDAINSLVECYRITGQLSDALKGPLKNALLWAVEGGFKPLVLSLTSYEADIDIQNEFGRTALHSAALSSQEELMKLMIENHAEVDIKDEDGRTPLFWAASRGYEAIIKLLLENGAEVDTKDKYGWTPLFWAASRRYEAIIKLLIENGAEVDTKNNDGGTPLFCAASYGQEAGVKLLLENGAEVAVKDNNGRTPLLEAAHHGHEAVVKLLLENGAKLAVKDNKGCTPLLEAAHHGHEAVVKLLLENGAKLAVKDNNGHTLLSAAAGDGHKTVVKLLLENGAKVAVKDNNSHTPLFWAARHGHKTVVKLLLENGAEVDIKDKDGQTLLSAAVCNGHKAVVKLLLENRTKVAVKDNNSHTLLFWAARFGQKAVVKLLFENGTAVDIKDNNGYTPLFWAANNGHEAVVKLLLENGAKLAVKDNDGHTLLFWAAGNEHEAVVKLLLENGAKLAVKDNNGHTPLFWAAGDGHKAVVKLLFENGAAVDIKDNDGWTPLFWAARFGQEAVVKLLIENGAAVDIKDKDSRTPLFWAASHGHEAVVELLLENGAEKETPLPEAASQGLEAVDKLLHDKQGDSKDDSHSRPVQWARSLTRRMRTSK